VQSIDNGCKELDQLGITIPEFIEVPGLLLEYLEDRIWRLASIDSGGDRVVAEILTCAFGILGQCGVEEGFELGRSGGCTRS
jgi:hypothetical protein